MKKIKPKLCSTCNTPILGRTDKKFCDDFCRNIYHNRLDRHQKNLKRKVHNILLRNSRIIDVFLLKGQKKVSREELQQAGFSFYYYTHVEQNASPMEYHCYDKVYSFVSEEEILFGTKQTK